MTLTAEQKTTDKLAANHVDAAQRAAYIRQRRRIVKSHEKVSASELIFFTTQLSIMLDSGVVLTDALESIFKQTDVRSRFRPVIEDILAVVKGGEPFSKAISAYPRIFNAMFISVIKAAEGSGKMAQMLRVLSEYVEFEQDTRKKVTSAMIYPLIMAAVTVVTTSVLLFFVLPKFAAIYESRDASLPAVTQFMLDFSGLVRDYRFMAVFLTVTVVLAGSLYYYFRTAAGRELMDYFHLRCPVTGSLFRDILIARSMRILATMLSAGVNILDAIFVVKGSCRNSYFQLMWSGVGENVKEGRQFSESLIICCNPELKKKKNYSVRNAAVIRNMMDPAVVQMLKAGEKGGRLAEVSDKISLFYEKKLSASIKAATALIEPVMIILMGIIVGTIAISLLMPVFRISRIIAG